MPLPKDGKLAGTLRVGEMTDGATYEVVAAIADKDGKVLSAKKETFTRKVMPFETAPKAGAEDLVPAPFTPPVIAGNSVSCVGRVYTHGTGGSARKPGRRRARDPRRAGHAESEDRRRARRRV